MSYFMWMDHPSGVKTREEGMGDISIIHIWNDSSSDVHVEMYDTLRNGDSTYRDTTIKAGKKKTISKQINSILFRWEVRRIS
jgi:hypothetical protein